MTVALQSLCWVLRRGSQFFLLFVWVFHMATTERKSFFFLLCFEEANVIAFARKRGERDRNTGISVLHSFLHFGTSAVIVLFSGSQAQGVICIISPERDHNLELPVYVSKWPR